MDPKGEINGRGCTGRRCCHRSTTLRCQEKDRQRARASTTTQMNANTRAFDANFSLLSVTSSLESGQSR